MRKTDVRHSVRHFCLECQGNSTAAVRECADIACVLWPHRLPPAPADSPVPPTAHSREAHRRVLLRAVRRHCLSCAGARADVRACAAREECALWSYRFGVRPETYRSVRERFLRPKTLSLFT